MEYLIGFLTMAGLFFFITGTVGILRMPNAYTRLHAATKCDTLGMVLVVFAILLSEGLNPGAVKLLFIIGFLWVTSPTAASVISESILRNAATEEDLQTNYDQTANPK